MPGTRDKAVTTEPQLPRARAMKKRKLPASLQIEPCGGPSQPIPEISTFDDETQIFSDGFLRGGNPSFKACNKRQPRNRSAAEMVRQVARRLVHTCKRGFRRRHGEQELHHIEPRRV